MHLCSYNSFVIGALWCFKHPGVPPSGTAPCRQRNACSLPVSATAQTNGTDRGNTHTGQIVYRWPPKLLLLHLFHGLFFQETWVSRHQKGKPFWILQDMTGWQWHQLDHMQIICTSLQTHNDASTSPLGFYRPDAPPNKTKKQPKKTFWSNKKKKHSAKKRFYVSSFMVLKSFFRYFTSVMMMMMMMLMLMLTVMVVCRLMPWGFASSPCLTRSPPLHHSRSWLPPPYRRLSRALSSRWPPTSTLQFW